MVRSIENGRCSLDLGGGGCQVVVISFTLRFHPCKLPPVMQITAIFLGPVALSVERSVATAV